MVAQNLVKELWLTEIKFTEKKNFPTLFFHITMNFAESHKRFASRNLRFLGANFGKNIAEF
uniref:Uncharacterized protein n=1 Tax=Romanomermis culicivorax TaxID=13658 RepID=A0A915I9N6_ROMCU